MRKKTSFIKIAKAFSFTLLSSAHGQAMELSGDTKNINISVPAGTILTEKVTNLQLPLIEIKKNVDDGCKFIETKDKSSYSLEITKGFWGNLHNTQCDYEITIKTPKDIDLDLTLIAGEMKLFGVGGNHHLKGTSTNFEIENVTGDLNIKSTRSDVTLNSVKGESRIDLVSGKIFVDQLPENLTYKLEGSSFHTHPRQIPRENQNLQSDLKLFVEAASASINFKKD